LRYEGEGKQEKSRDSEGRKRGLRSRTKLVEGRVGAQKEKRGSRSWWEIFCREEKISISTFWQVLQKECSFLGRRKAGGEA